MSALLAASDGGGFEAPGPLDFWQPLVGGDTQFALTRPMVVSVLSLVLISWWLLRVSGRLSVVPGKAQAGAETAGLKGKSPAVDLDPMRYRRHRSSFALAHRFHAPTRV